MAPALHLLLGLAHGFAEAVVHLLMDAVFIFVPDQVGSAVNGGLQEMVDLPGVGAVLHQCLEPPEAEAQLSAGHGQNPEVGGCVQTGLKGMDLRLLCQKDQRSLRLFFGGQQRRGLWPVQLPQVGQDHVRLGGQGFVRLAAL